MIRPQGKAGGSLSPEKSEPDTDATELFELKTPDDFIHYRDPVFVEDLRRRYLVNVVAMTEPPDYKVISPLPDVEVRSGIDLVVCGDENDVRRMALNEGLHLKDSLDTYKDSLGAQAVGSVEVVVAPRSPFAGKSLEDINFQDRFRVTAPERLSA